MSEAPTSAASRPRKAFYVDETMKTPHGYVPALVTEGESGFHLMLGNGECAQPWYWGDDIATAQRLCDEANERFGLTPEEAKQIIDGSIKAQIREDAERQTAQDRWDRIRTGREINH